MTGNPRAALAGAAALLAATSPALAQGLATEDAVAYRGFDAAPHYRAFLPEEVDLSGDFPRPANQGAQGSCTAWAVGYALRSFHDIHAGRVERRQPSQAFSPAYIYNQIKSDPGNCQEPTRISDALKFLEGHGTVAMAEFPYAPNDCSLHPPASLNEVAARHRLVHWQRVNYAAIDDVKGQLAQGRPVVFGALIPLAFEHLKAGQVFEQVAGPNDYGHAMVAVGYSDRRRAFKIINSWGTDWSDDGFGWIGYEAFRQNTRSAFTAEAGLTAPPPAPPAQVAEAPPQTVAPPPEPPPQIVVTPPAPKPPPPKLEELLKGFQCASLTGHLTANGPVVKGYVSSDDDLRHLEQRLAGLSGSGGHNLAVAVRPWPQCEALGTLARPLVEADGLTVSLTTKSGRETFVADDHIVITVRTPAFPSYLSVTYIQANGDAVHLTPATDKPMPASTSIVLGADPRKPSFRIGPPFGRELVVVVASARPLFGDSRPVSEEERSYLSHLRQSVLAADGTRVAAATAATVTQAEP